MGNDIGKMDRRDYENYTALYRAMMEYLHAPDLLIYLKADVDTLKKQIARRGRPFEMAISTEYLEQLNRLYDDWIARYAGGPLIVIESDVMDFVHDAGAQEQLCARIKALADSQIDLGL